MTVQVSAQLPEILLKRIDSIVEELLTLRQEVQSVIRRGREALSAPEPQPRDLATELYGSLGQGTLDEIVLDIDTKWERFSK